MTDSNETGLNSTVACRIVTTLMTMLAENVERMRFLHLRQSLVWRKNKMGSVVKSMSATPSAEIG